MIRRLVLTGLCLLLVACSSASAQGEGAKAEDVSVLWEKLVEWHPNPFHDTSRARFQAAADDLRARADSLDDDQLLVGLMRLTTLLGTREGHTGVFPLDPGHARTLHAYPLRLYEFSDGMVVIRARAPALVGARLVSIGGHPLDEVLSAVRPLVPRDNDSSLAARETQYLVSAEVLHGLGLIPRVGPVTFEFERGEARLAETLAPVTAREFTARIGNLAQPLSPPPSRAPAYLRRQKTPLWTTTLARGRVLFLAYNDAFARPGAVAAKLLRAAKAKRVRALVVDLRNNPGGDNTRYGPLLAAVRRIARTERVVVLLSRTTFSAAANFATDVERAVHPVFVGEPSGGSPNLYGDTDPLDLVAAGVTVHIARIYWQKSTPDDPRTAIVPRVVVPLASTDYFAGRDPVLDAGVRTALR